MMIEIKTVFNRLSYSKSLINCQFNIVIFSDFSTRLRTKGPLVSGNYEQSQARSLLLFLQIILN